MNALRRFWLAIYSLLLIAAAGALIALTWADDQQFNWDIGGWNFQALINGTDAAKVVFTIILGVIALIGLLTLILAVFRESIGAQRGSLRMRQADGGTIEVTGRAIEALLRDELQRLPDVHSVSPRVRLVGGAVDTSLDATIASNANIATVTSTLSQGVSNILRDQVGVTNVRRPTIRIEQDESPDFGREYGTPASAADGGHSQRPATVSDRDRDVNRDRERDLVPPADYSRDRAPAAAPPATARTDDSGQQSSTLPPPPPLPNDTPSDPARPASSDQWDSNRS
jgi:hypothetical protein